MGNTFSQTCQTLSKVGTKILQSRLLPLSTFCTPIEIQPIDKPALTTQVPIATVAPTTATGTSINYSSGDCTLSNVQLAHTRYAQCFGVSDMDTNNGARLEWLARLNATKLAETITDAVMVPITTATFGSAAVTATASAFTVGNFETLVGALASERRAVVLNTAYWAKVKPGTWMPAGFTGLYELSRWGSAGANVQGFCASPEAIVLRHGIALMPNVDVVARELMEIPGIGIVCEATLWFEVASRSLRASYGLYFGAAAADTAALKILTSA